MNPIDTPRKCPGASCHSTTHRTVLFEQIKRNEDFLKQSPHGKCCVRVLCMQLPFHPHRHHRRCYYYHNLFIIKETDSERLIKLSKVTQPMECRAKTLLRCLSALRPGIEASRLRKAHLFSLGLRVYLSIVLESSETCGIGSGWVCSKDRPRSRQFPERTHLQGGP